MSSLLKVSMFLILWPAKQCSLGLQYRECISCCPASCNLERTCIDSKLACLDGCYCPEGDLRFLETYWTTRLVFLLHPAPIGRSTQWCSACLVSFSTIVSAQVWSMRMEVVWHPLIVPASTTAHFIHLGKLCRRSVTTGERHVNVLWHPLPWLWLFFLEPLVHVFIVFKYDPNSFYLTTFGDK